MATNPITMFTMSEYDNYQLAFAVYRSSYNYIYGSARIATPHLFACEDVDAKIQSMFVGGGTIYINSPYTFTMPSDDPTTHPRFAAFKQRHTLKVANPGFTYTVKRVAGRTNRQALYYLTSDDPSWPPEVVEQKIYRQSSEWLPETGYMFRYCIGAHPEWSNIALNPGQFKEWLDCWRKVGDANAICFGSAYQFNSAAGDLKYVPIPGAPTLEVDPNDTTPHGFALAYFTGSSVASDATLVIPTTPYAQTGIPYRAHYTAAGGVTGSMLLREWRFSHGGDSDGDGSTWLITNSDTFGSGGPFAGSPVMRYYIDDGSGWDYVIYTVGSVIIDSFSIDDFGPANIAGAGGFYGGTGCTKLIAGGGYFVDGIHSANFLSSYSINTAGTIPASGDPLIVDPPLEGTMAPGASFTDTALGSDGHPATEGVPHGGSASMEIFVNYSRGSNYSCSTLGMCGCVDYSYCDGVETVIGWCSQPIDGAGQFTCSYSSYYAYPTGLCGTCGTGLSIRNDCASVSDCSSCGWGGECACPPNVGWGGVQEGSGCWWFVGNTLPMGGSFTMSFKYDCPSGTCSYPYPTGFTPPPYASVGVDGNNFNSEHASVVGKKVQLYSWWPGSLSLRTTGHIDFVSEFTSYMLGPNPPFDYNLALGDGLLQLVIGDSELDTDSSFTGKQARGFPWIYAHNDMTFEDFNVAPPEVEPTTPAEAVDSSLDYLTYAAGSAPLGVSVLGVLGSSPIGTVTVITGSPHNLKTGDLVIMAGWSGDTGVWNGTFGINVLDTTHFTYAATGYYSASGGTVTVIRLSTHYRYAFTAREVHLTLSTRADGLGMGVYRYTANPQLFSGWTTVDVGPGNSADITLDLDDGNYIFTVQELTKIGFWTNEYRCGIVVSATQPLLLPTGAATLTSFFNEPSCWRSAGMTGVNPDMMIKSTGPTDVQIQSNGDSGRFFGQVYKVSNTMQARSCPDGASSISPVLQHNLFKFDAWSRETTLDVFSVTGAGGTVTVITNTPHNMETGCSVLMAGWTGGTGTWNGEYIITKVNAVTFTYAASGVGTATGGSAKKLVKKFTMVLTFTGTLGGSNDPLRDGSVVKGTLYKLVGNAWVEQPGSIGMKLPPIGYEQTTVSLNYAAQTLAQTFELEVDGGFPTVLSLYPKTAGYLKVQVYEGDIDSIGLRVFEYELNLPDVDGYSYNAWFDLVAKDTTDTSFALPTGGTDGGTFVLVVKERVDGPPIYYPPCTARTAVIWKSPDASYDTTINSYRSPAFTSVKAAFTNTNPEGFWNNDWDTPYTLSLLAEATFDADFIARFNSPIPDNPDGMWGEETRWYFLGFEKDPDMQLRFTPSARRIGRTCFSEWHTTKCWFPQNLGMKVYGPSYAGGKVIDTQQQPVVGLALNVTVAGITGPAISGKDGIWWFYDNKAGISEGQTVAVSADTRTDDWAPTDRPSSIPISTFAISSKTGTITTTVVHGLETGDYVYIPRTYFNAYSTNTWGWCFKITKVSPYIFTISTLGLPCQESTGTSTGGNIYPTSYSITLGFTEYTGWMPVTLAPPKFSIGVTEKGKLGMSPILDINDYRTGSYASLKTYSLCSESAEEPSFQTPLRWENFSAISFPNNTPSPTWNGLGPVPIGNSFTTYTLDSLDGFKWAKFQELREHSGIGFVFQYTPGYLNLYDASATNQGQFIHYMPGKFALVGYKDYGVKIYDLNDYHAVNEHYDAGFDEVGGIDIVRYCGNNKIAGAKRGGSRAALMDATNKAKILTLGGTPCGPVSDVGLAGGRAFIVGLNSNQKLVAYDSADSMKPISIRYSVDTHVYTAVLKASTAKWYAGTSESKLYRFADTELRTAESSVSLGFVPYKLVELNSSYILAGRGSSGEIAIVKTADLSIVATLIGYGFTLNGTNCYTILNDTVRCYSLVNPEAPVLSWSFNAWAFSSEMAWAFKGHEIFFSPGGMSGRLIIAAMNAASTSDTYGLISCEINGSTLTVLDVERRIDSGSSYTFLHAQAISATYFLAPCVTETEFSKIDSFSFDSMTGALTYVSTKNLTTIMYSLAAKARCLAIEGTAIFVPQYDANLYSYEMAQLTTTFTTTLAFQMQVGTLTTCLHVTGGTYHFGTSSNDGLWKVTSAGVVQYGIYNARGKPGSTIWTNVFTNGNYIAVMGNRVTVFYEYDPAANVVNYRNAIVAAPHSKGVGYVYTMAGGVWAGNGLVHYAPIALYNTVLGGSDTGYVRSIDTSDLTALNLSSTTVSLPASGTFRPAVGALGTNPDGNRMYIWTQASSGKVLTINISNTLVPAYVSATTYSTLNVNVGSFPLMHDGSSLMSVVDKAIASSGTAIGTYILTRLPTTAVEVMGPNSGNRKWELASGIKAPWLTTTATLVVAAPGQPGKYQYCYTAPSTNGTVPHSRIRLYDLYTDTYDEYAADSTVAASGPYLFTPSFTIPIYPKQKFLIIYPSASGEVLHGVPEKLIYWEPPEGSITYMTMQLVAGVAKLGVVHTGVQPAYTIAQGYGVRPVGGWGKLVLAVGTFMSGWEPKQVIPHPWLNMSVAFYGASGVSPVETFVRPYSGVNSYDYYGVVPSYDTRWRPETHWASQKP